MTTCKHCLQPMPDGASASAACPSCGAETGEAAAAEFVVGDDVELGLGSEEKTDPQFSLPAAVVEALAHDAPSDPPLPSGTLVDVEVTAPTESAPAPATSSLPAAEGGGAGATATESSASPAAVEPDAVEPDAIEQDAVALEAPLAEPTLPLTAVLSTPPAAQSPSQPLWVDLDQPPLPEMPDLGAFVAPDTRSRRRSRQDMNSMLQEFSVMFRIDNKARRRKAAAVSVLVVAALGAAAWGILNAADFHLDFAKGDVSIELDELAPPHAEATTYLLIDVRAQPPTTRNVKISGLANKLAQLAAVRAVRAHAQRQGELNVQ